LWISPASSEPSLIHQTRRLGSLLRALPEFACPIAGAIESCRFALVASLALVFLPGAALANERNAALQNLKHIIVVMQENHSFDNYFGALAYAPGGVHTPQMRTTLTLATAAAAPTTTAASMG
jgi:phospholipase C